jgi:hypothetical protein
MPTAARTFRSLVASLVLLLTVLVTAPPLSATPAPANPADPPGRDSDVIAHWTPRRIASAQPRDLVIDHRGLAYLKAADGSLRPYNHARPYRLQQTATGSRIMAKPPSGGAGDTTGPTISERSPTDGATGGNTVSFQATVTDDSGVRSVDIVVVYPDERTQTFAAGNLGNNVYGTTLSGFTDGGWGWYVVAKDNARKGGNTTTSNTFSLNIDTSGGDPGGDPGGDIVTNSRWNEGGDILLAAGRILFEMPTVRGRRITGWNTYVCSGTTVKDSNTGASVILTAAHCVYDDVNKMFAQKVLFIPGQDDGGFDGTDSNCDNDPIGCFTATHGVVDVNWTTRTFPDNVEWDYAYYVVPDSGSEGLEDQVVEQTIAFTVPTVGDVARAMGYSYSDDPNFMYCAEPMEVETEGVNWWLPNCGLTGGSSGGPWIQPTDQTTTGSGPIISVNSWGYTNQPGMAGPLLDNSAHCVFNEANNENAEVVDRGVVADC